LSRKIQWLDVSLGLILVSLLLSTSMRWGWTRVETDFPNYYTGAAAFRAGLPLKDFYDWTWFQREMNYTGTEQQLGAYAPQTPLALLPFLPLAGLDPQRAKQAWLSLNLLLLAGTVVLLARVSGLPYRWVFSILLAGYGSLHSNFLLGQYYVLLTFLLASSALLFFRKRDVWAGASLAVVFALKLYSGPFLLFFLAKSHWRAAIGFMGAALLAGGISIAMFGWPANRFYGESILPSVMNGMLIDPYNPGLGSMSALLRRTFVAEPELNPHPAIPWPAAYTFSSTFFSLGLLAVVGLALAGGSRLTKREFAWAVIALLLLAPVNATYVFVLLAVPVALLMPECGFVGRGFLLAAMAITGAPLPRSVSLLFPRVEVLTALFIWAGWPGLRGKSFVAAGAAAVVAIVMALAPGPHETFERVVQPGRSLAVMEPALTASGPIYHGFGDDRYVLRTGSRTYSFAGHAFHPTALPGGGEVLFELVDHGHSKLMRLNPTTGVALELVGSALNPQQPAISPDGESVAFVSDGALWVRDLTGVRRLGIEGSDPSFSSGGSQLLFARDGKLFSFRFASGHTEPIRAEGRDLRHPVMSPDATRIAYSSERNGRQIWWRSLPDGETVQLTSAHCNHDSPVWDTDSHHLFFTSDCGRGLGLPGLYRAEVSESREPR
jgi:hypothetical protein